MKEELTQCPKCHKKISCLSLEIQKCDCSTVVLSKETKEFLTKTNYKSCLCNSCLESLNHLIHRAEKYDFPESSDLMEEGLHYYIENGYWVFTELYHLLRGYCCKSGCRHCVYGYKKDN